MRSFLAAAVLAVLWNLVLGQPTLAHRVNVFAFVEGDTVQVDCSYSKSNRVHSGDIQVQDAATGQMLLTGKTDNDGFFKFAIPPEARSQGMDLRIVLIAGEGHRNDWTIKAEEYISALPATSIQSPTQHDEKPSEGPIPRASAQPAPLVTKTKPAPAKQNAPVTSPQPVAPQPCTPSQAVPPTLNKAELEAMVEAAVEKKVAPLRRMLIAEKETGPGVTEIVGGIGYLLGIAGLLAYARSRKERE